MERKAAKELVKKPTENEAKDRLVKDTIMSEKKPATSYKSPEDNESDKSKFEVNDVCTGITKFREL